MHVSAMYVRQPRSWVQLLQVFLVGREAFSPLRDSVVRGESLSQLHETLGARAPSPQGLSGKYVLLGST